MTKKHYEAIARILAIDTGYTREVAIIAERLADYFAQDNPRFQRYRFLQACGLESKGARLYADQDAIRAQEEQERCKCGNLPYTDTKNCKECCALDKCTYGCGTCFCDCHR